MRRGRTATRSAALLSVLLAALSLGPRDAYAEGGSVASDREALIALYHATGGPNWTSSTNWLSDEPLGEWYGVTIDEDGRVTRLVLQGNGLAGELPPELGDLTSLWDLYLGGHGLLIGPVPRELGNLTRLRYLNVENSQLTGEIPRELGNLVNLDWLSLAGNELTGEIPHELGNLSNLKLLLLSGNELTGEIPRELGNLAHLDWLILGGNELTGEIPRELGNLANLTLLKLDRNQLTGEIPHELGSLANLEQLGLWDNRLTGEIPHELGSLSNLTSLRLGGNELSGCIPADLRSVDGDLESLGLLFCETAPAPPDSGNTGLLPSPHQPTGVLPPLALLTLLLAASTAARRAVRGGREAPTP